MVSVELLHDPLVHVASVGGLALLLGAAALHKLHDPRAFAEVLVAMNEQQRAEWGLLPAGSSLA